MAKFAKSVKGRDAFMRLAIGLNSTSKLHSQPVARVGIAIANLKQRIMEGCYYKKGASVIYHYKEWRSVMWSDSGYGYVSAWKRCKVVCTPRNAYGQFTTDDRDMESLTLKDEDGRTFQAGMDDVEPDRDAEALSRDELTRLWGEICKGSIYYSDYRNSLGVFEHVAHDWYEGFWSYLSGEYGESEAEQKDTAENFADYVLYGECA